MAQPERDARGRFVRATDPVMLAPSADQRLSDAQIITMAEQSFELVAPMLARVQTGELQFHQLGPFATSTDAQISHQRLLREMLGTADIAITAIAERIEGLNVEIVQSVRTAEGTTEDVVIDDHPAKMVFDNPGASLDGQDLPPLHTTKQQLRLVSQFMLATGEAYYLKVRDSLLGKVTRRLTIMPSPNVRPILQSGLIVGYQILQADAEWISEPASEVVRVWYPDPENIYQARGQFGSQHIEYDTRKFAGQHAKAHFERDAVPPVVLESVAEAKLPTHRDQQLFEQAWQGAYNRRFGGKNGVPAMIPPGFAAKVLNSQDPERATLLFQEHLDRHMLRTFRVPKSILGDISDAPARAAAETNQYVFDLYAVKPLTDIIADALTQQWVRPEFGNEYTLRFEPFVSRDKEHELARETADLANKTRTINEVRADRGLAIADWGEFPVGAFSDVPYTGDAQAADLPLDDPAALDIGAGDDKQQIMDENAVDPTTAFNGAQVQALAQIVMQFNQGLFSQSQAIGVLVAGFPLDDASASAILGDRNVAEVVAPNAATNPSPENEERMRRAIARAARSVLDDIDVPVLTAQLMTATQQFRTQRVWLIERARERKFSPAWTRGQNAVFRDQESVILKALRAAGLGQRMVGRALTAKEMDAIIDAVMKSRKFDTLYRRLGRLRSTVWLDAGDEAYKLIGLAAEMKLDPASKRFLGLSHQKFRAFVDDTTTRQVKRAARQALKDALAGGADPVETGAKVVESIETSFNVRTGHARTIARTEVGLTGQAGSLKAYTDSGIVDEKIWRTSRDDRVRPQHKIEGQRVPLDGMFTLSEPSGAKAHFPLDTRLEPGDKINCRCFVVPVVEGEE